MSAQKTTPKTNAMRELEKAGIAFSVSTYDNDDTTPSSGYGLHVAELLGEDPNAAFKTLITTSAQAAIVVCCIPVGSELDLKKLARAAGEKSLSMLPLADLEVVSGYVRGGVSPVGMKKPYPLFIDETAILFDEIGISGGKRGISLTLSPYDLAEYCHAEFVDICQEATHV